MASALWPKLSLLHPCPSNLLSELQLVIMCSVCVVYSWKVFVKRRRICWKKLVG